MRITILAIIIIPAVVIIILAIISILAIIITPAVIITPQGTANHFAEDTNMAGGNSGTLRGGWGLRPVRHCVRNCMGVACSVRRLTSTRVPVVA